MTDWVRVLVETDVLPVPLDEEGAVGYPVSVIEAQADLLRQLLLVHPDSEPVGVVGSHLPSATCHIRVERLSVEASSAYQAVTEVFARQHPTWKVTIAFPTSRGS